MRILRQTVRVAALVAVVTLAAPASAAGGDGDGDEGGSATEEASAQEPPRSDAAAYTQYVVQQAVDYYDAAGRAAAIARQSDPVTVDGQWYVFIVNGDGILIAHPTRPDLIGTSTAERRDVYGNAYGREIVAADEGGRWVDYFFNHPDTGQPAQKHAWVVRHDGLFFASGWYDLDESDEALARSDVATYTQYVVQQAIDRYEAEGREASVAYHNSPESVDGQWYVFMIDEAGISIAHPTRPDIVGTDRAAATDLNGRLYGPDLLAATEDGRWVDYYFTHPETGESERKHTWVVRHDGLLFASGWYRLAEDTPPETGPAPDAAAG